MSDFSQHTILVVDDEQDNLEVFSAALEMLHNAKVVTAISGEEALKILDQSHFTMIATDLSMPQMDGYALLHQIRLHPNAVGLPVIAVTAHTMKGDRENILNAGFDGYISKPFEITTLADELDLCLQAFAQKQTVPSADHVPEPQPDHEPEPQPDRMLEPQTDHVPEPRTDHVLESQTDRVAELRPEIQATMLIMKEESHASQ
ncbi:MAG: response regulator [Chloroflexota bacterium]